MRPRTNVKRIVLIIKLHFCAPYNLTVQSLFAKTS